MSKPVFVWILVAVLSLSPAAASQWSLSSPTTGTVSGLNMTNNYNNALDSLNTLNSGASTPTNQLSGVPSLGNSWLNTSVSPNVLSIYDGTDWVPRGALDTINHVWDGQVGGGVNTISSSSTTDLCSVPQFSLTINGAATINSFGATCPPGIQKIITFGGALILTNSAALIVPGGNNVTTAQGDSAIVMSLGGGNWQVASYTPANGSALINPAVDVGSMYYFIGGSPPSAKYLEGYGQAISRATYSTLLGVATNTQSATRTSGSPTLTGFTDTTRFNVNQHVEGAGIPTGATIVSTTSTTVTLSANAISSGTANVTVFYYGNGDGATTFNLPNCAGQLLVGRNNMGGTAQSFLNSTYALANPNALGVSLGSQSHTLLLAEAPSHSHSVYLNDPGHAHTFPAVGYGGYGTGTNPAYDTGGGTSTSSNTTGVTLWSGASASGTQNSTASAGGGSAHSVVNPMLTVECMIRVLP